jgi:hypothetical protein
MTIIRKGKGDQDNEGVKLINRNNEFILSLSLSLLINKFNNGELRS